MCVTIPLKIIEVKDNQAKVERKNEVGWIDISLLDEKPLIGDYLLSYQNTATNKLTAKEAEKIIQLFES